MRRIATFLLAVLFTVLVAPLASAQTVPGSAAYTWTLPTTGCTVGVTPCDNAPLTGADVLTGVEVYIATSPIADGATMAPTLTLPLGATSATYQTSVVNGQTLYARFKTVNASGKSVFSVQVAKLIKLPVIPGPPTNITVTIQIVTPTP